MTKYRFAWFVGGSALLCLFFVSLSFGAVSLSFYDVFNGLLEVNEKNMRIKKTCKIDRLLIAKLKSLVRGLKILYIFLQMVIFTLLIVFWGSQ